jgi:hypothetical protein
VYHEGQNAAVGEESKSKPFVFHHCTIADPS